MGRFIVGAIAVLAALVVVGALAIWVFHLFFGALYYLLIGAAVVGGGMWLYSRAKRALGPGTRARNRLDAASETYRMRNR